MREQDYTIGYCVRLADLMQQAKEDGVELEEYIRKANDDKKRTRDNNSN